jgi:hypothetical protein
VFHRGYVQDLGVVSPCSGSSTMRIHNCHFVKRCTTTYQTCPKLGGKLNSLIPLTDYSKPQSVPTSTLREPLYVEIIQATSTPFSKQSPNYPSLQGRRTCNVATEFVTRYAANPRVYASIRPNPSRIISEILHLRGLRYTSQVGSQSGTERLFGKAMKHLIKLQSPSYYWHDTLRIEISGPTQLPLALIVSVFLVYPQHDAYFNVAIGFACTVQDED